MKNKWIGIVALIIAIAAFFTSIKSCENSSTANRIATKVLNTSKQHFFMVNRPQVLINPVKLDDTNEYIKCSKNEQNIIYEIKLEIINIGNVTARNITLPNEALSNLVPKENIEYHIPPKLSLAPDEHYFYRQEMTAHYKTIDGLNKDFECIKSDEWPGIILYLSVFYFNNNDLSIKYRTSVGLRIYRDNIEYLNYEFEAIK